MSYAVISVETKEHQQGRKSAELNHACAYGSPINNPYPPASKEWLDWLVGYESWITDRKAAEKPPEPVESNPTPTPPYDFFWEFAH